MGTKRSVLTDENGLPLSVVLSGANTPDVKLLEATLDHIRDFPSGTGGRPPTKSVFGRRLHGQWRKGAGTGLYASYSVPRRGEKELERNPDFHARRWVVEVTHSFFNRFRKLLVRFEKKAANYLALVQLACAVIAWRKLIQVHR